MNIIYCSTSEESDCLEFTRINVLWKETCINVNYVHITRWIVKLTS